MWVCAPFPFALPTFLPVPFRGRPSVAARLRFAPPMFRRYLLTAVVLFLAGAARAQPLLPDLIGVTQKGVNVLAWTSQYDGIKSISVQRSSDSVYNYTTIGYVRNLKKGPQGFIDGHPLPGANWYRLYIAFASDLTWTSNRFKISVDSAALLRGAVLGPNDSLQRMVPAAVLALANARVDTTGRDSGTVHATIPVLTDPSDVVEAYIKSQYVFTNPFTGHVNVELPDVRSTQYTLRFYDGANHRVLDIPRIPESPVVIDKRNFGRRGLYRFELLKNRENWETGFITIY